MKKLKYNDMRKITFLLCLLVTSFGFSQVLLEDFEGATTGLDAGFGGLLSSTVVDDPEPMGTRGKVAELIAQNAAQPWQGANVLLNPSVTLTTDKVMTLDMYATTATDILVKVDSGSGPPSAVEVVHTGTGWETISVSFTVGRDGTGTANGVYPLLAIFPNWDTSIGATGGFVLPPVGMNKTIYIDNIYQGIPGVVPCAAALGSTSATCETSNGIGATDDTYSATVDFSGGLSGNNFVVTANSGTVGGDDPNVVASGTITVTGITEGTNLVLTVDDTADGGVCSLSTTVTSPSCVPLPTLTILEDFEPVEPSLTFTNGTGSANVIPDPTMDGRGGVLEIITADAQAPWQQAELVLQDFDLDLTTADKTVFVDWYSNTPFDALLGARNGGPASDAQAIHTGTGWETLEFNFNSPENLLPVANGVYTQLFFFPLWDADAPRPGATGNDGAFLNDGNANGSIASTTYIDIVQGPAISGPSCTTILESTSAICETNTGAGAADDTYTANINFTGGLSGNVYVISASSGTVGGDDPNVVASGTITVTGIVEGTDITVTVDDTADGGLCSLSAMITSPLCVPPSSLTLLEDFEGSPIVSSDNGLGGFNVIEDPLVPGNTVLEIISADSGQSWQQANVLMQDFFMDVNATAGYTVEVDVYSVQDFTMLARLDDLIGPGPAASPTATSQDFVSGSGWQTLTFSFDQPEDLPASANGQYSQIAFLPNWMPTGGWFPPGNFTVYVDNIRAVQGDPIPIVPVNYVYNNGVWAPSDPTGGNSNSVDDINIINGDVTLSADLECEDLTIQPGASLTIDTGVTVTTSTTTCFSQSALFSSLIVNGSITGTVNYHRFTNIVGVNDLASPPLSGQTFGSFATDPGNGNLAFQGTERAYAPYNTVAGEYQNYDVVANAGTIMTSGVGYRAATIDGNRLIYSGTPLSGDVLDVPITDAVAGKAWNLIGNPYSSYLDFDTFFNANLSQFDAAGPFQAIYGYDGSATNGWVVWNLATIADGAVTELIAPGQGFFVKSQAGGGLVDFTTSMRRSGTSDDFIQGRNASPLDVALNKLTLTSATNTANTSIYFIEGTTRGLDAGYDAGAYGGTGEGGFLIYTNLVENNEGLDIALQSLPYNDFNDVVIPVGVKALAGSALTIGLENSSYSPIPSNVNVYLDDTLLNTSTLLNSSDYTFTPTENLFGTGRFFLRYSADTLGLNPNETLNELIIYTNNSKEIVIKGLLTDATVSELYDIQGRLVLSGDLDQSSLTNNIDVSSMSSGIYIIKVSNDNSTKTQKLIIK